MRPKATSACCQPKPLTKATASGENRNWPNEPAAVPAPNASERICGGISRLKAAMTMVKDEPAMPSPVNTPAEKSSMPGVVE